MIESFQPLPEVLVSFPDTVRLNIGIEVYIGFFQGFAFCF